MNFTLQRQKQQKALECKLPAIISIKKTSFLTIRKFTSFSDQCYFEVQLLLRCGGGEETQSKVCNYCTCKEHNAAVCFAQNTHLRQEPPLRQVLAEGRFSTTPLPPAPTTAQPTSTTVWCMGSRPRLAVDPSPPPIPSAGPSQFSPSRTPRPHPPSTFREHGGLYFSVYLPVVIWVTTSF